MCQPGETNVTWQLLTTYQKFDQINILWQTLKLRLNRFDRLTYGSYKLFFILVNQLFGLFLTYYQMDNSETSIQVVFLRTNLNLKGLMTNCTYVFKSILVFLVALCFDCDKLDRKCHSQIKTSQGTFEYVGVTGHYTMTGHHVYVYTFWSCVFFNFWC